jgi:protein arginine N-methyltransferase 2
MLADGWDRKPNVRIVHARWQDVVDSLGNFDAVFFDTFDDVWGRGVIGGNSCNGLFATQVQHMHDFHVHLPRLLRKDGLYSFFNGICPENIFFQGVACQVRGERRNDFCNLLTRAFLTIQGLANPVEAARLQRRV